MVDRVHAETQLSLYEGCRKSMTTLGKAATEDDLSSLLFFKSHGYANSTTAERGKAQGRGLEGSGVGEGVGGDGSIDRPSAGLVESSRKGSNIHIYMYIYIYISITSAPPLSPV